MTLPAENQQTVEAALAQHTGFHDTLCQVNYAHKGLPCNCSLAENEAARAALRDLVAQADELRRTVEWYAERRNYVPAAPPVVNPPKHLMDTDAWDGEGPGARARSVLARLDGAR